MSNYWRTTTHQEDMTHWCYQPIDLGDLYSLCGVYTPQFIVDGFQSVPKCLTCDIMKGLGE
jgi:hypothetical protein